MQLNNQLEFITDNFILKLISNIEKNFLAENSTECLMQFEGFYDVGFIFGILTLISTTMIVNYSEI